MSVPKYKDPTVAYNTGYNDGQRDAFRAIAQFCTSQEGGPVAMPCTLCKGTKVVNWGRSDRLGGEKGPCICTPDGRQNVMGR